MMGKPDPDLPWLDFEPEPVLEARIRARIAAAAEAQALYWRFRLVTIETLMMGCLVLAAGLTIGQPWRLVLRASVLVAAGCFASGIILIGMTGAAGKCLHWVRTWWRAR